MALIATVTVSSITYAQDTADGTLVFGTRVAIERSMTGCTVTLGAAPSAGIINPEHGDREKCNVTYANNSALGYKIRVSDDANFLYTPGNWIEGVRENPITPGYCGSVNGGTIAGEETNKPSPVFECSSYSIDVPTAINGGDASATFPIDVTALSGGSYETAAGTPFNVGEHDPAFDTGYNDLVLRSDSEAGVGAFNFDFWYEVQVLVSSNAGLYTDILYVTLGS